MKLTVPSPTAAELGDILTLSSAAPHTGPATAPVDTDRYGNYLAAIQSVVVSPTVRDATVALVMATHPQTPGAPRLVTAHVRHGASPRAAQALLRAAQARALVAGRYHVAVDDLRHLATPVLAHRVHLTPEAAFDGVTAEAIVDAARQTALTA
jgi:MoxR-like ATPase